jgi:hypothetical protein
MTGKCFTTRTVRQILAATVKIKRQSNKVTLLLMTIMILITITLKMGSKRIKILTAIMDLLQKDNKEKDLIIKGRSIKIGPINTIWIILKVKQI